MNKEYNINLDELELEVAKQPIMYSETKHTKNSRQFERELRKTNIFFNKLGR
jgi:hypothetical protein